LAVRSTPQCLTRKELPGIADGATRVARTDATTNREANGKHNTFHLLQMEGVVLSPIYRDNDREEQHKTDQIE
jgi:hypothetical protein